MRMFFFKAAVVDKSRICTESSIEIERVGSLMIATMGWGLARAARRLARGRCDRAGSQAAASGADNGIGPDRCSSREWLRRRQTVRYSFITIRFAGTAWLRFAGAVA